jgi:hypothetical protein
MSITHHTCTAYHGNYQDIPDDATPGLLYLKRWFTVIDTPSLSRDLLSPSAVVKNNSAPTALVSVNYDLKAPKRNAALKSVAYELERAWDIEGEDGKRTVLHDVIIRHVFRADESSEVIMAESAAFELETVPAGETGGFRGLWTVELRSKHDRTPILNKRKELGC